MDLIRSPWQEARSGPTMVTPLTASRSSVSSRDDGPDGGAPNADDSGIRHRSDGSLVMDVSSPGDDGLPADDNLTAPRRVEPDVSHDQVNFEGIPPSAVEAAMGGDQGTALPELHLAATTLSDRSQYRGQVDAEGRPHGLGIWSSAFGTDKYSGEFQNGKKCGLGVLLHSNGATYAGELLNDSPDGYGSKISTFGERSVGQWCDGVLHGIAMSVNADGDVFCGHFNEGEVGDNEDGIHDVAWNQVEDHLHRALRCEQLAFQKQELARAIEMRVVLRDTVTIDGIVFESVDAVDTFTLEREQEMGVFVTEQKARLAELERGSNTWKVKEAQLKQRQKTLHAEILEARQELSYISKYCELAEQRNAQLVEAERTLAALQKQVSVLRQQVDSNTAVPLTIDATASANALSEPRCVRAPSNHDNQASMQETKGV